MSAVYKTLSTSEYSGCHHSMNGPSANSLQTRARYCVPGRFMCGRLPSSVGPPVLLQLKCLLKPPGWLSCCGVGMKKARVLEAHPTACLCLLEQSPWSLRIKAFAFYVCRVCQWFTGSELSNFCFWVVSVVASKDMDIFQLLVFGLWPPVPSVFMYSTTWCLPSCAHRALDPFMSAGNAVGREKHLCECSSWEPWLCMTWAKLLTMACRASFSWVS